MDRKELKIQALLEKLSTIVTEKENMIADLRVELTCTIQEKDEEIERLKESLLLMSRQLEERNAGPEPDDSEPVKGEVVDVEEEG